jgi:spore maturation protein CgeB
MKIVIYGLTITSSWGNGHATTYRSLSRALARKGHKIHFVEKDTEWYRNNRDLPQPDFCQVHLYEDWLRDGRDLIALASDADVVLVGSYFPDAIAASRALFNAGYGPVLFYDIDTPITMAQLRECGRTSYLELSLIPLYDAYLSNMNKKENYQRDGDKEVKRAGGLPSSQNIDCPGEGRIECRRKC